MNRFPESEYHVPFFDEVGYVRKLCPVCGEYFWTLNPDQETCGEATSKGCVYNTFIGNPPTRKAYSLREMREAFLSFFEKRGHKRIEPYPVVARWRDDLYFTHASIIDFQPYVTNGIIPPPANPLVISQPCIRFVDVDNVGPTFGRHLTIFEMGGHHAFNYPDKEVYWKDETVRFHHEFVTKELGIRSEEVVYKEDVWSGGGNAGPDLETVVRGLELATLVFMKFKVVNGEFIELPIRTVDTGYGIERYTWLSQGTPSGFQAVYGSILDKVLDIAGVERVDESLLGKVAMFSGLMSIERAADRNEAREKVARHVGMSVDELSRMLFPLESAFAAVDHTKCLVFMLAEGVVPSNVREGYLTRLMIRRTYRLLKTLGIEDKLFDIVDMQIGFWSHDFPHLKEMRDEILEMLSVEQDKFKQTLSKGVSLVKRIAQELKRKGVKEIPTETLIELYDSHGLPPEIVQEVAESEDCKVNMPGNFYRLVAERHLEEPEKREDEKTKMFEEKVSDLPETRMLYYEEPYAKEFEAKVLRVLDGEYVVLDRTLFYPEGGGQPADKGHLRFRNGECEVVDVQKIGKVILHKVKGDVPDEGDVVEGVIDWEFRYGLMKNHTATHIVNGAARRVLGQHVWQSGTQKGVEQSRLDISHYRRITLEEMQKIENLANMVILQNIPVETTWMPREEAERKYGFRLYQGGAIPGKEIRIVKTKNWEVEACAGTHVKNTGEIGFVKILRTERVQDGVERLVYSVGLPALKAIQEEEKLLWKLSETLNAPIEKLWETAERLVRDYKEARQREKKLTKEIAQREKEGLMETENIGEIKLLTRQFKELDVDRMIKTANEIVKDEPKAVIIFSGKNEKTARIVVMAGKEATNKGVDASKIAREAAAVLGGGGSGKPNFAQGGGINVEKLDEALRKAKETLRKQLSP